MPMEGKKNLKRNFAYLSCTEHKEINLYFYMYKSMFHLQDHRKYIWDDVGLCLETSGKNFFNSVLWFVSLILNFNALPDA